MFFLRIMIDKNSVTLFIIALTDKKSTQQWLFDLIFSNKKLYLSDNNLAVSQIL